MEKDLAVYSQDSALSGTPDCPVVHRTVSGAPDWLGQTGHSREFADGVRLKFTGLSGVHRTVRWANVGRANGWPRDLHETRGRANGRKGAPDCPVCTGHVRCANGSQIYNGRLRRLRKEIGHRTVRCAPDCPVHPTTEGKIGLPDLLSTAPSCLGAIKGTPRRMEEIYKQP
jgi:hypothetical protein